MKRRREEAPAECWVAGVTGLVSHSGRGRQRRRHPPEPMTMLGVSGLPGLKWSESDAFGLLSSERCPQAEWAVHTHIQESGVLGNLEWCKLRGRTINSCLD